MTMSFLEEMRARGLVSDVTDEAALYAHLQTPGRAAYIGFDPTRDSLTVGALVPIMMLRTFQRHGHRPVVLAGGGTGLIGDPSGKQLERPLLSPEEVEANIVGQRRIFELLLDFDGEQAASIRNNHDWLGGLNYLEFLRDVGKHMSIFTMFGRESVSKRRNEGGTMSYAEFSYQALQAYDFLHLHQRHSVTLQMGGSDQWGNILSGIDLIRRIDRDGATAFGLVAPLVKKSDGSKMGKSELGAVYLTADRTSPFALYQYFMNLSDEEAAQYVLSIADLPLDEAQAILDEFERDRSSRAAQRALADRVTAMMHGDEAGKRAEFASRALFENRFHDLDAAEFEDAFSDVAVVEVPRTRLADGLPIVEAAVMSGLASSNRDARQLLSSGALSVNGAGVAEGDSITVDDVMFDSATLLRRGSKTWCQLRWVD